MPLKLRPKVVAISALAFLALLLVLLTVSWESRALSRAVLAALSGPDLELDADSVRLSVLRGVLLKDVKVRARLEGGVFDLAAKELRLSHRLWRLLAGEVAVDEIVVVEPVAAVIWDAPSRVQAAGRAPAKAQTLPEPPPPPAAGKDSGLTLAMKIERLALEDATFAMSEQGTEGDMVRFEGLDFELGGLQTTPGMPLVAGLSAKGEVNAEKFYGGGVEGQGVHGDITIADGHLLISSLDLPTDFGTIEVPRLDLDLARDPYVFSLKGLGNPLRTNQLLGAASGFGDSKLEFEAEGDGSPKGGPRGRGSLAVAAGKLGEVPILSGLEVLLVGTDVIGRPYGAFVIPFELADGDKVTLAPFAIEAGNLRLVVSGLVDMAGPLKLHLEISIPRADIKTKEIPREVLDALTDTDERVKLQIVVAGTLDKPALRYDTKAWAKLAGRRLAAEALKQLFK